MSLICITIICKTGRKKTFNSCAEYGGIRKEVLWMNFEPEMKQITLEDYI